MMILLELSCCRQNDATLRHPFEICVHPSLHLLVIRAINIARSMMFVQRISVLKQNDQAFIVNFNYVHSSEQINFTMIGFILTERERETNKRQDAEKRKSVDRKDEYK